MPTSIPLTRRTAARTIHSLAREARRSGQLFRRASAHVPITERVLDGVYYTTLSVGTPAQTLNIIIDTGSSDLWLLSPACRSGGCANAPRFDDTASSSFSSDGKSVKILYGSGDIAGTVATDCVALAALEVDKQVFGFITSVDTDLVGRDITGLMGVAFPSISVTESPPFWQNLLNSNQLDEPMMSFALARVEDTDRGGTFTLGGLDTSLYTGDVDYVDVSSQAFWSLPVKLLTVNGKSISITGNKIGVISTATTLIAGPASIVEQVYAAIGGVRGTGALSGLWTFDCSTQVKLEFGFGSKIWPLTTEAFISNAVDKNTCVGSLFDIPDNDSGSAATPSFIIGEAFLQGVYAVFRFDPPAVGFAARRASSTTTANSTATASTPDSSETNSTHPPGGSGTAHTGSGSNGATIGGAVGGALGGLLIIGLLLFLFMRRRRARLDSAKGGAATAALGPYLVEPFARGASESSAREGYAARALGSATGGQGPRTHFQRPEMPGAMEVPDFDPYLQHEPARDGDAPYMLYHPEKAPSPPQARPAPPSSNAALSPVSYQLEDEAQTHEGSHLQATPTVTQAPSTSGHDAPPRYDLLK